MFSFYSVLLFILFNGEEDLGGGGGMKWGRRIGEKWEGEARCIFFFFLFFYCDIEFKQ